MNDSSHDFQSDRFSQNVTSSTRSASRASPSLRDFYDRDLQPLVAALESERSRAWTTFSISLIFVALFGFFVALYLIKNRLPLEFLLFVFAVGVVVVSCVYSSAMGGYKRQFKMAVVERMVRFLDPQLFYDVHGLVTQSEFERSQIWTRGIDRYSGEDFVRGTRGETPFRFSHVHAEYKVQTKNGQRWVTLFQGLFFVADFNKNFTGTTVVLPDTAQRIFGNFGQTLQSLSTSFSGRDLVKLEDPEFERAFAVYSTDQIEARYILSPALMRRLLDLKNDKACNVSVSFVPPHIHVALPMTHSMFEPPLQGAVLPFERVEKYLDQLNEILEIITQLDLNTRIWSKD